MQTIGVVVTTISNGEFLLKYLDAVEQVRQTCRVVFFVIGDVNTPGQCLEKCREVDVRYFACRYYRPEEQELFLKKVGFPAEYIPYRSDNRRNIGYLLAYEAGCDIIVSIDDDNFPVDRHYFEEHLMVGTTLSLPSVAANGPWFNPMCLLETQALDKKIATAYPRGFPYACRWNDESRINSGQSVHGKVDVNVGLWTGDPDIDAVTRLTLQCSTQWTTNNAFKRIALNRGQRMPINTQNTALAREAVVAYYFLRMNYTIDGMRMDRFGDIFSGYFLLKCTESVGNIVSIGHPLSYQARNEHNLLNDLKIELPGILIIENLLPFLEDSLPPASNYFEAYAHLTEALQRFVYAPESARFWSDENRRFIDDSVKVMKAWSHSLLQISSGVV